MADPTGTQILPPNAERALEYSRVNPKDQPVKYLYPDGSVWSGLPVFGAGGSGGGGLTDDELRDSPIDVTGIVSSSLSGASTNGTVTLTSASTAYAIPATGIDANHTLMVYNGSDTDIFIGFATLTSGGILLPSGGVLNCDLGANQVIYGYCASAGKIVNYSTKKVA